MRFRQLSCFVGAFFTLVLCSGAGFLAVEAFLTWVVLLAAVACFFAGGALVATALPPYFWAITCVTTDWVGRIGDTT